MSRRNYGGFANFGRRERTRGRGKLAQMITGHLERQLKATQAKVGRETHHDRANADRG